MNEQDTIREAEGGRVAEELIELQRAFKGINFEATRKLIEELPAENKEEFKKRIIAEILDRFIKMLERLDDDADIEGVELFYSEFSSLKPYISAELQKRPEYKGMTAEAFLHGYTGDPESEDEEVIAAARKARDAETDRQTKEKQRRRQKRKKGQQVVIDPLKLKEEKWLPLYQGALNNEFMRLSIRDFIADDDKKSISKSYIGPNGKKYSIEQFDQVMGSLSTSTKKILDVAVMYLSMQNYYRSGRNSINAQVKIPLIAYLEKCGHDLSPRVMDNAEAQTKENSRIRTRIKQFKNAIRRDLNDLRLIRWTAEEKRGSNAGDYVDLQIISGHRIVKDVIYINFDIDAAWYLVNAHPMWFPTCLLKHDNRKSNPYPIGRKMALTNSMDSNFFAGNDCTLSVLSLLNAAPEIPLITELQERGQRNWKDKIKKPLESALNENIAVGYIKNWEYRHPKTGQTYTAETAHSLSWESYCALMVDYTVAEAPPPEQEERRKKIMEEKLAAKEAGKTTNKKRGRPRKKARKEETGP